MYSLFAEWRRIELPVASFSEEGVKEVKGLDDSPYTSLQFLELETNNLRMIYIVLIKFTIADIMGCSREGAALGIYELVSRLCV